MTLSVVLSVISLGVAIAAYANAHWRYVEQSVAQLAATFFSHDAVKARHIVGRAARTDSSDSIDKEELTEAVFTLLWLVQSVEPVVGRHVKGSAVAVPEARLLYWHVGRVVIDLSLVLGLHGTAIFWKDTGIETNRVLERLPKVTSGYLWWKSTAEPTTQRLPAETASEGR